MIRKIMTCFGALLLLSATITAALADTSKFDKAVTKLMKPYLSIHKTLVSDSTDGVTPAAKKIAKLAKKLNAKTVTGKHKDHYATLPKKIQDAAAKLVKAKELDAVRDAFKELSRPLVMWATMSKPNGIHVLYCDMAKGSWLQDDRAVRNPYYGTKMLKCGEILSDKSATQ